MTVSGTGTPPVVLRASGVTKVYPGQRGEPAVRALRGVDLTVEEGTSLGIVGESGCGKSTLGRMLVGLESPTTGTVEVEGHLITASRKRDPNLARQVQLVFQDPFSSLNPRMTVAAALTEVLRVHHLVPDAAAARRRVSELLAMVSLAPRFASRLPHEMSGGQAQRVAIARALAVEPKVLVLDEPTSALDVSVRAEIVNLLLDLRAALGLSYVFISHDMAVIRHVSDRVGVMYKGAFAEVGPATGVFAEPLHPYTRVLLDAVPDPNPDGHLLDDEALPAPDAPAGALDAVDVVAVNLLAIDTGADGSEGEVGCPYRPRCPLRIDICARVDPPLLQLRPSHLAACHVAAAAVALEAGSLEAGSTDAVSTEVVPPGAASTDSEVAGN
jgi:ABC-type oligopeptide transport system ATPase subunit